jgi:hypothetical protein
VNPGSRTRNTALNANTCPTHDDTAGQSRGRDSGVFDRLWQTELSGTNAPDIALT